MDRHAVPRQVTTFEFKLIGYFTIKQFAYLLLFAGFAVVTFFIIPVPILNFVSAVLVALLGIALVFYKHNERPLDVWIKNLLTSLLSPSQYYFAKHNEVPAFLKGVYLATDEEIAQTHIDANQKLSKYMMQTGQQQKTSQQKQEINTLIHTTPGQAKPGADSQAEPSAKAPVITTSAGQPVKNQPFLSGIVKNSKGTSLQNIMVYINSEAGQVVRILKTNHNGIFATFHPLPSGNFIISPKDLGGEYFFDTMNVTIEGAQSEPLQIFSKELL